MPQFACPHCGHAEEFPLDAAGTISACPKCGDARTIRFNQPDEADQRGTAAGKGANPVVLLVVGAVIVAFAAVGVLAAFGLLPLGSDPLSSEPSIQDREGTIEERMDANDPSLAPAAVDGSGEETGNESAPGTDAASAVEENP